jgi:acetyl esterase/lipase
LTVLALIVAGLLIVWMSMLYVTLPGIGPYLPRVFAAAYSLELTLVGVGGALLGAVAGSVPVTLAFAAVAVLAGIHVLRVWGVPEVLGPAFGSSRVPGSPGLTGPHGLRRPWGLRVPPVPEARVERDVAFVTPPGSAHPLLCDLWQPPVGVSPSGLAFIYFHGSAWVLLDKDAGTRPLFRRLAAQGHVIMDVAYRLYPETDIEGMVGDVRRSIAWMKAHAAAYGVEPDRVVVGGGSAGGHLALLAAYSEGHPDLTPSDLYVSRDGEIPGSPACAGRPPGIRDEPMRPTERQRIDTSVRGVLVWYAPVDLRACYTHYHNDTLAAKTPVRPDWDAPPSALMRWLLGANARRLGLQKAAGAGRLDWILGGSPEQAPERYTLLSPISHVTPDSPPTLLMQGTVDIIVPQGAAKALRDRMRRAGAQMALLMLPRIDHGFDLCAPRWSPSARKSMWHAERFLALMARPP